MDPFAIPQFTIISEFLDENVKLNFITNEKDKSYKVGVYGLKS